MKRDKKLFLEKGIKNIRLSNKICFIIVKFKNVIFI